MFFVFNRKKMNSYFVALSTVVILFVVAFLVENKDGNAILTSVEITKQVPICKVDKTEKQIAITINCAENMNNISEILDTLSRNKIKVTFYITGEVASKNTEAIQKIVNSDNEIGSLSNTYTNMKNMSLENVRNQITTSYKTLKSLTNKEINTFRAPYGDCDSIVIGEAQRQNLKVIGWNIDTLDYNGLNGEEMLERVEENLSQGSIILMHNSSQYIIEGLEKIAYNLKNKGYDFKTVTELLYKENYTINNEGIQIKNE